MESQKEITKKLKAYFEKHNEVVMAFLFGSRAKKRIHSSSDWDIAVYFRPKGRRIEWENQERTYSQEHEVWNACVDITSSDDVDLIVLNRAPTTIAEMAIRGIPLVIKDRRIWLEFMLIVTGQAADFRQTAREYAAIYWRSASLTEQDLYALDRRLIFLDSELKVLPDYAKITWSEYQDNHDKRRQVERLIENLMNAAIDIAKIILASQKQEVPSTYKEILRNVGLIAPFSLEVTQRLSQWADLRNILAHEYLDIRWSSINTFLKEGGPVFHSFTKAVRTFLLQ